MIFVKKRIKTTFWLLFVACVVMLSTHNVVQAKISSVSAYQADYRQDWLLVDGAWRSSDNQNLADNLAPRFLFAFFLQAGNYRLLSAPLSFLPFVPLPFSPFALLSPPQAPPDSGSPRLNLLTDSAKIRSANTGGSTYSNRKPKDPGAGGYKYTVGIDSAVSVVSIRETMFGSDVSVPQTMSLDEYLARRKEFIRAKTWDSLTHRYDLKFANQSELDKILGQATGLVIPLPPNVISTIFGKPEISINVSGEINVHTGWKWTTQNLGSSSPFGQTQSSPIFSQDIQMNVSAKIGDKFKLGVDWNTKRQFEFDNTFKVAYEGYDDDIIRRVEAGNVQLQTPSTLIGGSQALFGLRADFQLGPVYIKTLASQKRGQSRTISFKGGALRQPFALRAYDYAKNHFFLDTAYKRFYAQYFQASTPVIPRDASQYEITSSPIELWESTPNIADPAANVIAYDELPYIPIGTKYPASYNSPTTQIVSGSVERGRFVRMVAGTYDFDKYLGTISIWNFSPQKTYAVAYAIKGGSAQFPKGAACGTFSPGTGLKDTLILKLVYRPNLLPGYKNLWARQMKNIYQIGPTNVNVNDTKIGVWYYRKSNDSTDILEGATDKLVTVLRVDQVNNASGAPPADGLFDMPTSLQTNAVSFFNAQRGEISFPSLEPFRQGFVDYFTKQGNAQLADRYVFSAVYDTTREIAALQTEKDKYIISGEASGSAGNRISLPNGFNLAPGSVRVYLDGVPLTEGTDFSVEYFSGTVTLRSPRAALPNANISIDYEQNDVFNLSTRTLTGARLDFDWKTILRSRDFKLNLGATIMSYDQALQIDRVRLGEEPVSNIMYGFDGQFSWDAKWLTRVIDALPFYNTKEPSTITMRGEWAMMLPDPNKKKSDVPEDGSSSVVYIDDFEGSQRYIPLGLTPSQWIYSAQPEDTLIGLNDITRSMYRGQTYWFRYFVGKTSVHDVYPNRQVAVGSNNLSELYFRFSPDIRGIYNKNPLYIDSLNPTFNPANQYSKQDSTRSKIWGGMTRLLSSFNTNFDTENIDYIELMVNFEEKEPTTKMYIDLGQISEDIIPNQALNTEDGITAAYPIPNGIIDQGEDVGIDAISDTNEKNQYPAPLNLEGDPARDNYFFDFNKAVTDQVETDFIKANNFEGNATQSQLGQFPDQEILNKNNGQTIMLDNSYFEYEVNLNTNPAVNSQIVGGNNGAGWFLYRIPIRGSRKSVGNPQFANIQYVRLWAKGGNLKMRIADWRLAGAQWQRFVQPLANGTADTTMNISFVNREENSGSPDFYTMPPGVSPPLQLSNPDPSTDLRLNEQSLALSVKNLRYGDERTSARFYHAFDMFYYKHIKFFIHGDGTMPSTVASGATPPAIAYIRFGMDSLNYYEYQRPLVDGWQSVDIPLAELTAIKESRPDENKKYYFAVPNDPLAKYAVVGNPVLTRIEFIGLGIANPAARFPNLLTTTMWVDELRLIDPENSKDWAGILSTQVKLADLGNMALTYNKTNPNFHRLEERFGNRIATTNWSFTSNANFDKFAPKDWTGTAIPVSYSHIESLQDPVFVAQSDINLSEAASLAYANAIKQGMSQQEAQRISDETLTRSQTYIVQDQFAVSGLRVGIPSKMWYIRDTFDKLLFSFNYGQNYERSPVVSERFKWEWNLKIDYGVTLSPDWTLSPLKWLDGVPVLETYKNLKISFTPSQLTSSITFGRSRQTEQSRFLDFPSPVVRTFFSTRQIQLNQWKLTEGGLLNTTMDYSLNVGSTLIPLELDDNYQQRSGSEITSQMFFHNGQFINLGDDRSYTQTVTLNFKPKIPPIFSIDKFLDGTGSFTTNYRWDNQLQPIPELRDIAKSARFDNTIRFSLATKLKSLGDSWFGKTRIGFREDSTKNASTGTTTVTSATTSYTTDALQIMKLLFLDYENITMNFNQTNSATNPGILGGTGITNFWARSPFTRSNEDIFGPSTAYQLGLIANPHGGFSMVGSNKFPFFCFETSAGLRPPNATLQDNFAQQSSVELRTNRPLWKGANLELNWRSTFSYNQNETTNTDSTGVPTFSNIAATHGYQRTYLSLPSFLFFSVLNNTPEHVKSLYYKRRDAIDAVETDTVRRNELHSQALAESFETGLESLSFFSGGLAQIMPRVNWSLTWEGLEKMNLFGWDVFHGLAKTVRLEHKYVSTFQKNESYSDATGNVVQSESVDLGFQPLIGLAMQFDETKLNGNMTANLRYNTKTNYALSTSDRGTISKSVANEFSLQVTYNRKNFELPLFGTVFKNDLELSLLTSYRRTKRATYQVEATDGTDGSSLDGTTNIIIEPRARYAMSRTVTASLFFRYEANLNEGAATPGTTTTQIGLDIRIAISGGK